MKYLVQLGERTVEVRVAGASVTVDGRTTRAVLSTIGGTPVRQLELDGEVHELIAERGDGPGRWRIAVGDARLDAVVVDERAEAIRGMLGRGGPAAGGGSVVAPMPGLVVRVNVEAGQRVEAGTGLLVVEAMKMENQLSAAAPGVVRRVLVAAGQAVEKGERLLELDPL
jgi:propionyl-CoA carboxylase alpha chain